MATVKFNSKAGSLIESAERRLTPNVKADSRETSEELLTTDQKKSSATAGPE